MLDTKKKYGKTEAEIMAVVGPSVGHAPPRSLIRCSPPSGRIQKYYDGELPKRSTRVAQATCHRTFTMA
jgi:hypothetical protein